MEFKTAIITGGTSGIGYEAAKGLLMHDYHVVLAGRNKTKGTDAVQALQQYGSIVFLEVDFAELASIQHFADQVKERYTSLDCLINNAGVMIPPLRYTKDGFELQFGTNHLAHFALTGLLLPLLLRTPQSRVVTISSIAAIKGFIDFDNLDGSKRYKPMVFYRQSKHANWLFAKELQLRLTKTGASTISIAAHPGLANTNLLSRGSGKQTSVFIRQLLPLVTQSTADGAKPTIYAATDPSLHGGEWVGPNGFKAWRGSQWSIPLETSCLIKIQPKNCGVCQRN
ncbi:oxidoreductase [Bacillus sp. JCM 19041]|uniref:oxidoreductase n=1 Tax=Bacillus sp. JCM 19041 TaxID=1460637 RepID=UPI000ACF6CFF